MKTSLDELERLAKAATPGPWEVGEIYADNGAGSCQQIYNADGRDVFSEDGLDGNDAAYIAAANPAAILELTAELRRVTAQRDRLRVIADDAATSLETIEVRSYGDESHLNSVEQMRNYAGARALVARKDIAEVESQS